MTSARGDYMKKVIKVFSTGAAIDQWIEVRLIRQNSELCVQNLPIRPQPKLTNFWPTQAMLSSRNLKSGMLSV